MFRQGWLAVLIVLACTTPGLGQGQGQNQEAMSLKFEMIGGQTLSGAATVTTVQITTELGRYAIWPAKLKTIEFAPKKDAGEYNGGDVTLPGTLTTTTGETLRGEIYWQAFSMAVDLGGVVPNPYKVKKICFSPYRAKGQDAPEGNP